MLFVRRLRGRYELYYFKGILPGWTIVLGNKIMNMVATHRKMVPISSNRNPNHSFDALLWKSMRKFALTLSTLPWKKLSCFPKQRIVITPETVSEK